MWRARVQGEGVRHYKYFILRPEINNCDIVIRISNMNWTAVCIISFCLQECLSNIAVSVVKMLFQYKLFVACSRSHNSLHYAKKTLSTR